MKNIIFISVDQVIKFNKKQIVTFGGTFGIRDKNLLEAAVHMPKMTYQGNFLYTDSYYMAAAYMFHIIKNHPFVDGNKRTGAVTSLVFSIVNGLNIKLTQEDLFDLAIKTAISEYDIEQIVYILKQ